MKEISAQAKAIADILDNKKAQDIVAIHVADMTIISDYFVVASASNISHVQTLAEEVQLKMFQEHGIRPARVEGVREGRWIVLDYGETLVHLFHKEEREFYQLERLWKNGDNYFAYNEEEDSPTQPS